MKHPSERLLLLKDEGEKEGAVNTLVTMSACHVVINECMPNRPWRKLIRACCIVAVSCVNTCYIYSLTGTVFLGGFRVLERAEESLAEIHREVLHV